jgi:hypothetical protein
MRFWVPDTGRNEMRASANRCYLPMDRFPLLRRVLSRLRSSIRQGRAHRGQWRGVGFRAPSGTLERATCTLAHRSPVIAPDALRLRRNLLLTPMARDRLPWLRRTTA